MDKQTELKVLLCDKFLLLENLQATANQTTSEIQQIKQLIAKEMSQAKATKKAESEAAQAKLDEVEVKPEVKPEKKAEDIKV